MTASIYRGLKNYSSPMLDSFLIDKLSVEIFEKQIFSSNFHPISEYMFRLSFLTTLNIYKNCFKGHQRLCKCGAKLRSCELWLETDLPLFIFLLKKLLCLYTVGFCNQRVSWSSSCVELKNFAVNIFLKLVSKPRTGICVSNWLVTYWESCIENERLSL